MLVLGTVRSLPSSCPESRVLLTAVDYSQSPLMVRKSLVVAGQPPAVDSAGSAVGQLRSRWALGQELVLSVFTSLTGQTGLTHKANVGMGRSWASCWGPCQDLGWAATLPL